MGMTDLVLTGRRRGLPRLRAVRRPSVERVCAYCGVPFTTGARRVGRYCSREHADLGKRMTRRRRVCAWCGAAFEVRLSLVRRGKGKYCSRAHYDAAARAAGFATLRASFEARVKRRGDGCWTMAADDDGDGYWLFSWHGQQYRGHRVAYRLYNGDIPSGMVVRHRCIGRRWCVNPEHLILGTAADNRADTVAAGRQARGETNAAARLSEAQVLAMRARYDAGGVSVYRLAKDYGMSQYATKCVVKRITWKHLA